MQKTVTNPNRQDVDLHPVNSSIMKAIEGYLSALRHRDAQAFLAATQYAPELSAMLDSSRKQGNELSGLYDKASSYIVQFMGKPYRQDEKGRPETVINRFLVDPLPNGYHRYQIDVQDAAKYGLDGVMALLHTTRVATVTIMDEGSESVILKCFEVYDKWFVYDTDSITAAQYLSM